MDNERPVERNLWSSRLEEPGALPGMGLTDKAAAWDKLYLRLQETPRRRTLPRFWAAAACLLLALIISPKMAIRPRTYLSSAHNPQLSAPAPAHSLQLSAPSPAAMTSVIRYPPAQSRISPPSLDRTPRHRSITPLHPVLLNPRVRHSLPPLALPTTPGLSIPLTLATAHPAAPKKEQRVIHINELEASLPSPAALTGERLKPGRLRFGFGQQETFRPTTTWQGNDHPILSFKPSQNP
jgi:hypothetical protein